MNPFLATVTLVLATAALFALPLLPALYELRRKHDAEPLTVIQQYAGEIRHFAGGFRNYIDALRQPLQECVALGTSARGTLRDGDEYLLLGRRDNLSFGSAEKMERATCPLLVAAGVDLVLPSGWTFLKEIYASGQFVGGEESTYRAILGDKDVHLQRASKVMRWAHAAGDFQADDDCDLYGRISSDGDMLLRSGCTFQRLNAPRIAMGSAGAKVLSSRVPPSDTAPNGQAPEEPVRRRLIEGDWEIRSGVVVTGNVVSRGKLHIEAGARVRGSVKSNGEMVLDSDVVVDGSLISAATMHIGPRCQIRGPVIAEHGLVIESGSQCGTAQVPTTVSAPIMDVKAGSLFFGTLWAREQGRVVPSG
jgi:predicted acyltransferase (DUF342 family)